MNRINETLLSVLRAALKGEQLAPELTDRQWQELFALAQTHKILPLVYETVYTAPSLMELDPQVLAAVKSRVRKQVMLQTVRTGEFLRLYETLSREGIRLLVVKGAVCRNLYPQPDHRPSGDEDVLLPPGQLENVHRLFAEFGMQAQENPGLSAAHEITYRKQGNSLHIELHKTLFPPQSDAYGDLNRFFVGAFDRAVTEQVQGVQVATMGYTDHLFYLLCHAFKHFLHSGFGIRQVCDIMLYANRYAERIDWTQILENCRQIRAEKFAVAVFQIGKNHLGVEPDRAACPTAWRQLEVDEVPMLEDLLSGGLYGDATMGRRHSSNMTLEAVAAQKQGRRSRGVLSSVFPPADKLEGRYPYLRTKPYLLPVAWGQRLLGYAREATHTRSDRAAESVKLGNARVALLKQYGILE